MIRSPNYGRGRKRPKHLRRMYLGCVERFPEAGVVVITICKIELLRQGAWSVPMNEAPA